MRMREQLALHEGFRATPYRCTKDKLTIGYGYNIDARGWEPMERILGMRIRTRKPLRITPNEAEQVLRTDIQSYEGAVRKAWPHYDTLDEVRQRVVLDMAFNMGYRLKSFKNTQKAIEQENWTLAAANMMQSLWSQQVGDGIGGHYDRAERLKDMMLTGHDYAR